MPLWRLSRSRSRWDFHFHSYVLTIYVCLYWILELVVFNSLVRRGCIRKVSVQLVPKYFSRVCSTDSFSCSEQKNWKKKRSKQCSKTKEGKSKFCCRRQSTWLIIALLSHRYCYAVALLLLRCRTAIAPLSFHCRSAAVDLLPRCCRTAIAPLSLHCRSAAVAIAVATQSHRYCTAIAPLSLRCCCSCVATQSRRYRTAIAPLLRRCWTAVAPAQIGYKQFKIELILLYCHSTVTYAVDRKVHMVVASRGIIRVTVTIGDCQARVSSSLEGFSTSQKTVKVETY